MSHSNAYMASYFGKLILVLTNLWTGVELIQIQSWQEAFQEAYAIRYQVFIQEQGVPEDFELDELDSLSHHALAFTQGRCVGTARLVNLGGGQGQIGRMAVLSEFRRRGIGIEIMHALMNLARSEGISQLILHSQTAAIPFYEQLGFTPEGPIYDEAGIPHRNMILLLSN